MNTEERPYKLITVDLSNIAFFANWFKLQGLNHKPISVALHEKRKTGHLLFASQEEVADVDLTSPNLEAILNVCRAVLIDQPQVDLFCRDLFSDLVELTRFFSKRLDIDPREVYSRLAPAFVGGLRQSANVIGLSATPKNKIKVPADDAYEIALMEPQHCFTPETRVLSFPDSQWVDLGSVVVGDTILGFDEYATGPKGRKLRPTVVESVLRRQADVYKVSLVDGSSFQVTRDHPLLLRSGHGPRWQTLGVYLPKDTKQHEANHQSYLKRSFGKTKRQKPPRVVRFISPWDTPAFDFEAGWMSGFLDGEGCISRYGTVEFTQARGPVLDRATTWLTDNKFRFNRHAAKKKKEFHRQCDGITVLGGIKESIRLLGLTRPTRLLVDFTAQFPRARTTLNTTDLYNIESIESVGVRDVVNIQTSTGTYIAEGLAAHNCNGINRYYAAVALPFARLQAEGTLFPSKIKSWFVEYDNLWLRVLTSASNDPTLSWMFNEDRPPFDAVGETLKITPTQAQALLLWQAHGRDMTTFAHNFPKQVEELPEDMPKQSVELDKHYPVLCASTLHMQQAYWNSRSVETLYGRRLRPGHSPGEAVAFRIFGTVEDIISVAAVSLWQNRTSPTITINSIEGGADSGLIRISGGGPSTGKELWGTVLKDIASLGNPLSVALKPTTVLL